MASSLRLLLVLTVVGVPLGAQDPVSNEYRIKAAFLHNFFKFVEWPPSAPADGPLSICVAGRNPFGPVLEETIKGESISGRPLDTRVILEPEPGCHIVFVPDGAATTAYLRAASGTPTLTVGERPDFIAQGGMVSFFLRESNVHFAINPLAAERVELRISARLLQLAEIAEDPGDPR